MLSSEESTTERINLLEAGAEDFILKPLQSYGAEGPHQEISLNNKINGYVILYLHR